MNDTSLRVPQSINSRHVIEDDTGAVRTTFGQTDFVEGEFVKLLDVSVEKARKICQAFCVSWDDKMADLIGTTLKVKDIWKDKIGLYKPDGSRAWVWPYSMIEKKVDTPTEPIQATNQFFLIID